MRVVLLLVLAAVASGSVISVHSQTAECGQRQVIANVSLRNGSLLRGLRSGSFVATFRGQPIPVELLEEDRSPRRIAFLVDTGSLDRDVRKTEHHILKTILSEARPEESFSLVTVRGIRRQVPFGVERSAFEPVLVDIANPPRESSRANDLLPSLKELLSTSQLREGDGVIVIARDLDFGEGRFSEVLATLVQRGIRVYAFQLGPTMAGEYLTFGWSGPFFTLGNESTLRSLAWNSGGYIMVASSWSAQHSFKFTPERAELLRIASINSYRAIVQFYRLRIVPPQLKLQEDWALDVVPSIKDQAKQVILVYPRLLQPCESARAAKKN
jgi:hypothetical protein